MADTAEKKDGVFVAVYGLMIDPESGIRFDNEGKRSARTGWLDFQIANGKIEEVKVEEPAPTPTKTPAKAK